MSGTGMGIRTFSRSINLVEDLERSESPFSVACCGHKKLFYNDADLDHTTQGMEKETGDLSRYILLLNLLRTDQRSLSTRGSQPGLRTCGAFKPVRISHLIRRTRRTERAESKDNDISSLCVSSGSLNLLFSICSRTNTSSMHPKLSTCGRGSERFASSKHSTETANIEVCL